MLSLSLYIMTDCVFTAASRTPFASLRVPCHQRELGVYLGADEAHGNHALVDAVRRAGLNLIHWTAVSSDDKVYQG